MVFVFHCLACLLNPFLKMLVISITVEKVGGEREGAKHRRVVASHASPAGDLAHNPGMCPDGN